MYLNLEINKKNLKPPKQVCNIKDISIFTDYSMQSLCK